MDSDVLQVVVPEEIPELIKIFEKQLPKSFLIKQFIKVLSEYKKAKVEHPDQTIYRYGDVENGTYLIQSIFPLVDDLQVNVYFLYTTSEDLSELRYALTNTSRIPWSSSSKLFYFEITFDRFSPVVCEVAKTKGVDLIMKENYMMWLPEPVGCSALPEEDMYLERINESHVTEINSNWPHRFPGSEVYLGQQIRNNYCLGLFRITDNKLACSALTFQSGGIFVLYTDPEFRGKGYGSIIVQNISSKIHEMGRIPFATILLENIPSQKLFTKAGFKHFTKVHYLLKLN